PVGAGADAVAVGVGRVWVASNAAGTLTELDPQTGAVRSPPSFGRPHDLTVQGGRVYVASLGVPRYSGTVAQFDAASGDQIGGVVAYTCSLTSGVYGVWIAGCPDVYELTVDGGNVAIGPKVAIPFRPHRSAANQREALGAMAMGEGAVWVIGDAADP